MSIFAPPVHGSSGVDTGDIPASLRFRKSASAYASRVFGTPTDQDVFTFSCWGKLSDISTVGNTLLSNSAGTETLYFNANKLEFYKAPTSYASTALYRDPTSQGHIVFTSNAGTVKIYFNNTEVLSQSVTPASLNSNGVTHYIGRGGGYFDGYLSRVCFVDGQALTPSSFGYQNTTTNEWTTKTAAQINAAVVASGGWGNNGDLWDFDDATSLTTLGYGKYNSKNWTLNNVSLTAGTTYDHMLDVPGNSFATLNPLIPSAANITNGNLTSGTTAVRATMNALAFDSKWEVTAGGSAVTAGVISGTGTTNTTSVTANKTFAFRLTTAGALDYKNVTDGGSWTSITTGLTGEQYPYGVTQAANWNFGQAPLHASATYQSAAGGYFFDTTAGYKALCQRNIPDGETITTSGSFTGNLSADGPCVDLKGVPTAMTINGNAVTFGTHADKTAFGFKARSSSSSYNNTGSNTYSVTSTGPKRKYALAKGNP